MAKKEIPAEAPKIKTWWIVTGVILLLVLILIFSFIGMYNSMVRMNEDVNNKWAQVETQYQRRVDLIPNLVNTVQGYANFEKSTLTEITALRSQWQTASTVNDKVNTANQIESTLSKLLVISENYPDLKANTNFLELQAELANTENKIAVERGRYNDVVRDFNAKIKTFPRNIFASMFGFTARVYFQAEVGSEKAPVVKFP